MDVLINSTVSTDKTKKHKLVIESQGESLALVFLLGSGDLYSRNGTAILVRNIGLCYTM